MIIFCPALKCNLNKASLSPRKIKTSEIRESEGQGDSRWSPVGTGTQTGRPHKLRTRWQPDSACVDGPFWTRPRGRLVSRRWVV